MIGLLVGIFLFGETVPSYWGFFNNAGFMGRYTIPEWLQLDAGVVVFIVVVMALGMFWGAEKVEKIFSARREREDQA